jgi:Tfp pilus assembly protein PilO
MSAWQHIAKRPRAELLAVAAPVVAALALLGLFIVPNYMRARQWEREAFTLKAVAHHAIGQQNDLVEMQSRMQSLRAEMARRGRRLPETPDQGLLLDGLTRAAELKGMVSHEARSGQLRRVPVPGLQGGAASRRSVDADMRGSFEALFQSMQAAESLPTLVTVRSVEMVRSPSATSGEGVHASFSFDEYFAESAAADAATDRKHGGQKP